MSSVIEGCDPFSQASFTLSNRLLRMLWSVSYYVFFRFSPRPMHHWRSLILKCFGAKIGKNCHVYPSAKIWAPWNLEMDDQSSLADGVNCYSMAKVILGKKCVVSQNSFLCCGTHDYESKTFQLIAKPIVLADHTWIAAECFIGPGVTINDGAVIGARSVVSKDMPAWQVCVGHPCKPIKPRTYRP